MNAVVYFWCLLGAVVVYNVWGLQFIPERANVAYANDKYFENMLLNVKRYARRGNYYINLEGTTKHTLSNNVSIHLYFYEFLHNEYKRSFVELHFKLCDMVNKDPYVGKAVATVGFTCPLKPGTYKFNNITNIGANFPNVVPFEKCKVVIKAIQVQTEEPLLTLDVYASFKQKIGVKQK